MAIIRSGENVTANGDYDFVVKPGLRYMLEFFYVSGTGTVTVKNGNAGTGPADYFQNAQVPDLGATTDWAIAASSARRSGEIVATGNRIRLTVASASSLNGRAVLIPVER